MLVAALGPDSPKFNHCHVYLDLICRLITSVLKRSVTYSLKGWVVFEFFPKVQQAHVYIVACSLKNFCVCMVNFLVIRLYLFEFASPRFFSLFRKEAFNLRTKQLGFVISVKLITARTREKGCLQVVKIYLSY